MAEGYRPQVDPRTAVPFGGAGAESFGAPAARGLTEAGESIDRAIHAARQRDRENEAAAAGVEMAEISTELEKAAVDARTEALPGAEGHSEAISKMADDRIAAALGRIQNKRTRDAFTARYEEIRGRIFGNEYAWEAGARVAFKVENIDKQGTILANGLAANPTAAGLEDGLATIETTINELDSLPGNTRAKAIREQQRKLAAAWGNAMQAKDPRTLIAALDKNLLADYLEPEDINSLRSGGLVEIRRGEAAERQARSQAEADAREQIGLIIKRAGDGDTSITADEFKASRTLAKQYGLQGPEWDLGVAEDKVLVSRETQDWTPVQYDAAINELAAKGDKRTAAENVRYAHLVARRPAVVERFKNDFAGAMAASGNPAPAIEWDAPTGNVRAQVQARMAWWRAAKNATGSLSGGPLDNNEAAALRDRVNQGPAGQLEVARQLRTYFGRDAVVVARQVDRDNKGLQLAIGLPERTGQWVQRGAEALKRSPKLFDKEAAEEIFAEYSPAIPPDMRPAVWEASRSIVAGHADEQGEVELTGGDFDRRYRAAIHRAVGATGVVDDPASRHGGFVTWSGGKVWIPPSLSANDFARKLSRAKSTDWIDANSAADGEGPGGAPYYQGLDGKLTRLDDAQLARLKEYRIETTPVLGVYQLVNPRDGGHIVDKNGRPWHFNVNRLP